MSKKTNRVTVHLTVELARTWEAGFAPDVKAMLRNRLAAMPGVNHVKIGHITKVTPKRMEGTPKLTVAAKPSGETSCGSATAPPPDPLNGANVLWVHPDDEADARKLADIYNGSPLMVPRVTVTVSQYGQRGRIWGLKAENGESVPVLSIKTRNYHEQSL